MADLQTPSSAAMRIRLFGSALCVTAGGWLIFEFLAAQAPDGATQWEQSWIRSLRDPENPSRMIGPPYVEEWIRDCSGLGGYAILTIVIVTFTALQAIRGGRPRVRFFLITTLGGFACNMLFKSLWERERPAIVPHLSHVVTSSFPSGHSMMSAIVYLTIGALLAERSEDYRVRILCLTLPLALTCLVGFSRVAMGVHYPTDVLAGWTAGILCTLVALAFRDRLH